MLRFLADENLHGAIVRGLSRRCPGLDIVRAQDVDLSGSSDADLLAWAADRGRLVLTHDVSTLTHHTWERVRAGLAMPGVIEIPTRVSIAQAIEDLLLLAEASQEHDWEGQIIYLPL